MQYILPSGDGGKRASSCISGCKQPGRTIFIYYIDFLDAKKALPYKVRWLGGPHALRFYPNSGFVTWPIFSSYWWWATPLSNQCHQPLPSADIGPFCPCSAELPLCRERTGDISVRSAGLGTKTWKNTSCGGWVPHTRNTIHCPQHSLRT